MPNTSDVGVIVGRFQVHRLHDAHRSLIESVYTTHAHTIIVLGLSQVRVSHRNPLDFEARKQMVLESFPNATVLYIKDEPTDDGWSRHLDSIISELVNPPQTVTLYGSRDSFLARYSGHYPTETLEPTVYASGSEMRKSISKRVKSSEDFRAGVIWASANGWPKFFPTVDVAINDDASGWLLVRKSTESLWRFAGGFMDPLKGDDSFEAAGCREVREETGVQIDDLRYIASLRVDDWRYRDENDKIMTILYRATYIHGPVRPGDDVVEARWFTTVTEDVLVAEHRPLWRLLMAKEARNA